METDHILAFSLLIFVLASFFTLGYAVSSHSWRKEMTRLMDMMSNMNESLDDHEDRFEAMEPPK